MLVLDIIHFGDGVGVTHFQLLLVYVVKVKSSTRLYTKSGNHLYDDLAKLSYKPNRKIKYCNLVSFSSS